MHFGALEAGGTKMVCAVLDEERNILARKKVPTLEVASTLDAITDFFAEQKIDALGIGSFGPLCLREGADNYGDITTTPKPGWAGAPLTSHLRKMLSVPVKTDTDVNAAALAEYRLGAGKGLHSLVYYTVGTGIGGGAVAEGKLLHGLMHPEMGHILLHSLPEDTAPEGFCPYHGHCLEGLASGGAIEKRWKTPGALLPPEHPAWKLETEYLAQMCVNTVMMLSPEIIVLGGGVMHQTFLFDGIRARTLELLGGYIAQENILNKIKYYIVPSALGDDAGMLGAWLLAKEAWEEYT